MDRIPFGLEKAVQVIIHAAHSITLHTLVCIQLPSATTDRIELRICTDQPDELETVLVLFAELYVQ